MRGKEKHIRRDLQKFKHIEMHLADNCNLDCSGCSHFSSIVDKEDGKWRASVEQTEKDFKRMSELFYQHTKDTNIWLMGGEPLLHNDIIEFMRIARTYFPGKDRNVWIITNGILLLTKKDDFWDALLKYDVKLKISVYPPLKVLEKIKKKCKEKGVSLAVKNKPDFRTQWLDLDGPFDMQKNYDICGLSTCINLREGRMFTCCMVPHVRFFNKKFNQDLPVSGPALDEGGGIDIHREGMTDLELAKRLSTPVDLCKFCIADPPKTKWMRTQGKLKEWAKIKN
jgi:hypothetical protein